MQNAEDVSRQVSPAELRPPLSDGLCQRVADLCNLIEAASPWPQGVEKAKAEVCEQFSVHVVNSYYSQMCDVGRKMMLELIRIKAQDIYDYRCGKQVYRKNRKKGS